MIVKVAATFTWVLRGYGLKTFKDFPRSKGQIHHPSLQWGVLRFHGLYGIDKFLRPDSSLYNIEAVAVGGAKKKALYFDSERKPLLYFGGKILFLRALFL